MHPLKARGMVCDATSSPGLGSQLKDEAARCTPLRVRSGSPLVLGYTGTRGKQNTKFALKLAQKITDPLPTHLTLARRDGLTAGRGVIPQRVLYSVSGL